MDIKIKCEKINILCHGCLAEDRTVHRISREISEMFYELRNDKRNRNRLELVLCWECMAFLKKLQMFKVKIKTAQGLLMQYIKCHCKNDPVTKLSSLSTLYKLHSNTFDYEFEEEEKPVFEEFEDQDEKIDVLMECDNKELEDVHQNENFPAEELLTDVKVENDDSLKEEYKSSNDNYSDSDYNESVPQSEVEKPKDKKEEYKSSNDNDSDSDYNEPVPQSEVEEPKDKPSESKKYYKNKSYRMFATVTKRMDVSRNRYLQFVESVSLKQKEYEKVLKRDGIRYGYHRMQFKCDECKEGYLKKIDLQRHKSLCHRKESTFPYKCANCPTMVTSLVQQEQHWAAAHSKQYKCTICTEVHQSVFEIERHVKNKHRVNCTCNECGFHCGSLYEFRKHYKKTHEKAICDYCNVKCTNKRALISHIQHCHTPAYCSICNRTYVNGRKLRYHNQATHPELYGGTEARKELSYCVECDKQYPTEQKYKMHLQQSVKHIKPKKVRVPCPECGKIFSKTNYMNNHYNLVHLKVTKNYCDQCNKYYTTAYGLRKHIRQVHKKIALPKDKMCDLCGRGFSATNTLKNHRRTHTGERPFKCKYCPAAFAQKYAMKTHQRTQHKNVDLPS